MGLIALILFVFALAALPAIAIVSIVPVSRPRLRFGLALALFTLLVTPSWGAATIVSLPMPFGALLLLNVIALDPAGVIAALLERPVWHLLAFPITALVAAFLFRRVRPN